LRQIKLSGGGLGGLFGSSTLQTVLFILLQLNHPSGKRVVKFIFSYC